MPVPRARCGLWQVWSVKHTHQHVPADLAGGGARDFHTPLIHYCRIRRGKIIDQLHVCRLG